MAVGIKVELPIFLHLDSLEHDITSRAKATLQKRNVQVEDVPADVYSNLFSVVERDSVNALAKQNIRWEFGAAYCILLHPTDDELASDAETLTDHLIETIDSTVGTTIFITMAALSSLAIKGFGKSA